MPKPPPSKSNIVRLASVRESLEKKKAEKGQPKQPLYSADILPLLEEIETLQGEVQELRNTIVKLLRLLKSQ